MSNIDSATKAYAAITAQLSQFDNGGDDDENNFYNDDNNFDIDMDMDVEESFVSSRSQTTNANLNTSTFTTGTGNNRLSSMSDNSTNAFTGFSSADISGFGGGFSSGLGGGRNSILSSASTTTPINERKLSFGASSYSPVATPATSRQNSAQQEDNFMHMVAHNEEATDADNYGNDNVQDNDNEEDNQEEMPFQNAESLDGDYRPYHEAIDSFLTHISVNEASASTKEAKFKLRSAQLKFMNRIMRSNYDRSTMLQKDDDDMEHITITRHLEKEGHFWSLLIQLLEKSSLGVNENFLLWKDQNQDSRTGTNKGTSTITSIQKFIETVVKDNVEMDPATMVHLIESYFEQDEDDNNNDHGNDSNMALPPIITRRRIILEWIESCHNRSILGFELGAMQNNAMWSDTLKNLKYNRTASGKITSFHPDAPLLVKLNNPQNKYIDPLHGNDGATETYLLSTCLSLIKAGRFDEALECCRKFGQAWRAAAWGGNGAHGYQIMEYDEQGMDVDDNQHVKKILVGNPKRALWKRSLWLNGQSMHSLLISSSTATEKQIMGSGSLVYEAAITNILADDVKTALMNPVLKRHWMDLVWVYYRGKQSRFMEQVYCTHNNARRSLSNANKCSLEGTEFEAEEKEQLSCTEEINTMDDGVFLRNLEQEYVRKVQDDEDLPWRPGMCSFLSSMNDIQSFLIENIQSILVNAQESKESNERDTFLHEQEVMLRFIFHLVFLLDSLTSDDEKYAHFRESVIVPYRDDLILLYLQRLMMHRPLWKFTCLYASLLPMEVMTETLTDFWMSSIHDDNSRRMLLNQARDYLSEGLDLVILRKVVRASISLSTDEQSKSIKTFPTAIMKKFRGLKQKISQDDLMKMHSIHWLCIHNEHYADALVCANMLLRQFLLQVNEDDEEIGDWSGDTKLTTAKLFKSRFLTRDLIEKATNGGGINEVDDMNETNGNKMCIEEFQEYLKEFEAIGCFLDAHNAYEAWKDMLVTLPASIQFHSDAQFSEGSLESEIAMKMDKRNYIQKKRKNGIALIKVAEVSYQNMMKVLTYEGGFLSLESNEPGVVHSVDEMRQRSTQMISLKSKCLPLAVFLMYRVLTETAHWMNEFVEDIMNLFKDEALDILSRIHMVQDDEESTSPFLPESWHSKASLLANVMNEVDGLLGCFDDDDIEYFNSLMTETETLLKDCTERKI